MQSDNIMFSKKIVWWVFTTVKEIDIIN